MDLWLLTLLLTSFHSRALAGDGNGSDANGGSMVMPEVPEMLAVANHSQENPAKEGAPLPPETVKGDSSEELVGCEASVSSAEVQKELGNAMMKFGLRLLEELPATEEQPNVMVSPLSVTMALSQLALGAVGDTETQLLRALHVDALPCYHKALRHLLHQARDDALQVASRLYLRPEFAVKPAFVQGSQQMYDSYPAHLSSLEEVNEWVKAATKGQVTDFLSSLPPNVVLMLINAVHFKGEWEARFDPRFTSTDVFYVDDKHEVKVDMMHGPKYPLSLLMHHELEAQVARFPFKDHKSLLVVIPTLGKVNVSAIAAKFNTSELYASLPEPRNMEVKLPRFRIEYGQELEQALTSMGLGKLFWGPNLSRIAESPLLVSSVQHKTSMELREEGAEAAAATGVSILRWSPFFGVNQPFFFALVDDHTQAPVFLGVVNNPNPGTPLELRRLTGKRVVPDKGDEDDDEPGDKMADKQGENRGDKVGPRSSKSQPK
ncbi:serpin peptidase inhibitor, clade F (alpha-2 antiplasmin, pigment epithelium derived factor), member 2b [Brienomyrus brachyistius]|uniref:serpin peptidase inhibitor, clade F (alpha-2 antiplasmin, pigment epithelium derived factor), member 2b n=1 Tax=Brienomyrus brachyistius TaxID=42636 RepID=UPI0020B1D753|nr:serpin peptidase inhibitor, clade F (alpha-2 antiplasmin, pigment epithelium derived factor), member 2b [Brienomyrus brachyistius]XP_048836483.1 serpin peptidase inhibitor, clade F (alpha-2 antiplasmin, pigment epithelium derived factor), member 2b [Brienomyrus brachyistius]